VLSIITYYYNIIKSI